MCWISKITGLLVIIGGLNWGLVGAADINLVDMLLGAGTMGARIVYIAVGLSALYMAYKLVTCAACTDGDGSCKKS